MALIAVDVSSGTWTGLENIRVIELDDREVQGLDFKSDSEIIGLGNAGEIPIVPSKHYAKAEMILEWLDEQEFTRSEDENRVYDLSVRMANAHALLAVADASRITELYPAQFVNGEDLHDTE